MNLLLGIFGQWQRILVYAVVAAAIVTTIWMHGYFNGKQALYEYQGEQAKQAVKIIVKQGEVTERVITKYIRVKAEAVVIERTIEKEVIRYAQTHPGLCLDHQWRRLHDAAATGALSDPTPGADAEAGIAPTAAEALLTTTENYARCIRNAQKLDALQEWVRGQQEANPQNP